MQRCQRSGRAWRYSRALKSRLYEALVLSILLYNSELRLLSVSWSNKLNQAHHYWQQCIMSVSWKDKVTNMKVGRYNWIAKVGRHHQKLTTRLARASFTNGLSRDPKIRTTRIIQTARMNTTEPKQCGQQRSEDAWNQQEESAGCSWWQTSYGRWMGMNQGPTGLPVHQIMQHRTENNLQNVSHMTLSNRKIKCNNAICMANAVKLH